MGSSLFYTFVLNSSIVILAVLIHYEALRFLPKIINRLATLHRVRVVLGIFGALVAHVIEVWLFGISYFLMIRYEQFGRLVHGMTNELITSLEDCLYFSFTTYTSLGYGDLVPEGWLRFLAGLEALTGLVLITWTASFMFIEMQKFWRIDE